MKDQGKWGLNVTKKYEQNFNWKKMKKSKSHSIIINDSPKRGQGMRFSGLVCQENDQLTLKCD